MSEESYYKMRSEMWEIGELELATYYEDGHARNEALTEGRKEVQKECHEEIKQIKKWIKKWDYKTKRE